jgi:RNA polymerase sigma factor (sigma-70 family)
MTRDEILWNEFRKGDFNSFRLIYDIHFEALISYGLKFTDDREQVKDVIHDLFVEIFEKRSTLGQTDSVKPFLFKILKRKLLRALRKDNSSIVPIDELPFIADYSMDQKMDDEEIQFLQSRRLKVLMKSLPPRQQEALYLKFVEEIDYEGICAIMEVNYQSARNLVHRAIEKLRDGF